ncbi:MAG: S-layer homology domain-containing protein [Desulfotomaculaceae bacterium]|nr:S-layer homology domain-containing protein [Desulfotomaculaceae bacterium]
MRAVKKKFMYFLLAGALSVLLFAALTMIVSQDVFAAQDFQLEVTGDGVANPGVFTRDQLTEMQQHQQVYSAVNTWPTKKWYTGRGVPLRELLKAAEIKENATMIKFTSNDGYTTTLTVKELLVDKRYYYPHFKDNSSVDGDGNIAGSDANAAPVEPIIALVSVEGSNNPAYMNDLNTPLLMLGQRAVTEQNGNLFVKYLNKIEVLTDEPPRWDTPRANPDSGVVMAGSMIALSNENMDDDKVYYTTDGSTPTLNSPMYNWIAKRWWSARADELGNYNKPIGPINKDTVIKAVTIGPGKEDSEVATFTYKVATTGQDEEKIDSGPVEEEETVFLRDVGGHWAQKHIETLVAFGAIGGYPDGTFKPDNPITRAEFAGILVKTFQLENRGGKIFADTADHWAKEQIATATAGGIINGYDASTFGPDDLITREQMAVMIFKAARLASAGEETGFADNNSISPWARQAVAAVVQNGIMSGYPDNTVQPQGRASRAEAATVMIKALDQQ